jgi:hypothetical protein
MVLDIDVYNDMDMARDRDTDMDTGIKRARTYMRKKLISDICLLLYCLVQYQNRLKLIACSILFATLTAGAGPGR